MSILEIVKTIAPIIAPNTPIIASIISVFGAMIIRYRQAKEIFPNISKKTKISKLTDALDSKYLDDDVREFIHLEIQREYFFNTTKILAEKPYRNELLRVHEEMNKKTNISWYCFKSASQYFRFKDGKLLVDMGLNKLSNGVTWGYSVFCALIGIVLIFSFISMPLSIFDGSIILYASGPILIIISLFILIFPLHSFHWAKKIKAWGEEN